jgi:hypothetical protein
VAKKPALSPEPWKPAHYDEADAYAIRALLNGEASKEQQQRALAWIVNVACGTYDQPFRPGEDGKRNTDFACGKQFVGQQIVKLTKIRINNPNKPRENP